MAKTSATRRKQQRARERGKGPQKGFPVFWVALAGIVGLFAIALLTTRSGDDGEKNSDTSIRETRSVEVTGEALPAFESTEGDPAVGMTVPDLKGSSFDGSALEITNDGRPKLLIFLAHWCPHCQAEVPVVQDWINQNGMPEDVDLFAVSTGVDSAQPNYPPSGWLEQEGWTVPTLADAESESAGDAFGTTSFPYFVAVAADGTVVQRASGELPAEDLERIISFLGSGG